MKNELAKLKRLGNYTLKHSIIGWWVDGRCGYSVASYYDTPLEAIVAAIDEIKRVKSLNEFPAWLFK